MQLGVGGGWKGVRTRSGDSGRALFNLSPMIEVGSGGISACTHKNTNTRTHTLRSATDAGPDGARVMEAADRAEIIKDCSQRGEETKHVDFSTLVGGLTPTYPNSNPTP